MDYEQEIKRLRRLNMKMYFTMSNIISVLNNTETEELYKITMTSIDKDMIFITNSYDNIDKEILLEIKQLKEESKNLRYELFNSVNFLMKKELETTEESCGCGKPPQQIYPEIENYLNNISQNDMTDSE